MDANREKFAGQLSCVTLLRLGEQLAPLGFFKELARNRAYQSFDRVCFDSPVCAELKSLDDSAFDEVVYFWSVDAEEFGHLFDC